jgi:hypothetical protein
VTFLMVFVIQNTQSRDTQAMQLKLDELIRVNEMARNSLINLEEMSDIDVERMKAAFAAIASNRKINGPDCGAGPGATPGGMSSRQVAGSDATHQEELLRSIRNPNPPRTEEIDSQHEVGLV